MNNRFDFKWYKNRKVLITGHTGFKGSWLCEMLTKFGAKVVGYSLPAPTNPSLYNILGIENRIESIVGDIRDRDRLFETFERTKPEIVIHMAAQPIVRESYKNPVETYETNVMGTVNVLEASRKTNTVKSILNVTTDKVYRNREWEWGYRENEELDGYDPYSNSKSCSELVSATYKRSFFDDLGMALSTARAGNVIGGGDFAPDRIIPDCVRSVLNDSILYIRNPASIRPYEHVTEPLRAYLMIAAIQADDISYAGSYNIGPNIESCISTRELVNMFSHIWKETSGKELHWEDISEKNCVHEANYLKLDCSKVRNTFSWAPKLTMEETIKEITQWTKIYMEDGDIRKHIDRVIDDCI